jgi:hypothetical protein
MCHNEPENLWAAGSGATVSESLARASWARIDPSTFGLRISGAAVRFRRGGRHGLWHQEPDEKARRMMPRLEKKIQLRRITPRKRKPK